MTCAVKTIYLSKYFHSMLLKITTLHIFIANIIRQKIIAVLRLGAAGSHPAAVCHRSGNPLQCGFRIGTDPAKNPLYQVNDIYHLLTTLITINTVFFSLSITITALIFNAAVRGWQLPIYLLRRVNWLVPWVRIGMNPRPQGILCKWDRVLNAFSHGPQTVAIVKFAIIDHVL